MNRQQISVETFISISCIFLDTLEIGSLLRSGGWGTDRRPPFARLLGLAHNTTAVGARQRWRSGSRLP